VPAELLAIVAPVYIAIGLGWGWNRAGRPWNTRIVTELIMTIGAPCLVFSSLVGMDVEREALARMALAAFAAFATLAVLGFAVLKILGLPARAFLAPIVFPNAGNMGLPVALFAFGDEGLALGVAFYAVAAFTQYSVGIWLWSGRVSGVELARTPLFWSAILAAGVVAAGFQVPDWILRTTGLLGGFTIPLMQISLGYSLGGFELGGMGRSLGLSLLRLGLGLAVGWGLAWGLGFQGAARGVLILQCSMPVAVLNYLLAEKYGQRPSEVASLVVLSTLLSLLTLPGVLLAVL
jgi:predicted permease